jgi:AmmeMemoRadiSam system protein A
LTPTTDFPDDIGRALVALARKTIMEQLGLRFPAADATSLEEALHRPAAAKRHGVFVTLTIGNHLRGCIGTLTAEGSVVEGVARHAINAAFHDPRFSPLTRDELARVSIEVSILSEPCALSYTGSADLLARLRPGIDGVILSAGYRSATFLPQVWAQLPEPAVFLSHLCLKAGLAPDSWQSSTLGIMTYQVQHFSDAHP